MVCDCLVHARVVVDCAISRWPSIVDVAEWEDKSQLIAPGWHCSRHMSSVMQLLNECFRLQSASPHICCFHPPGRCGMYIVHMIHPPRRCGIYIDHMIHPPRRHGVHFKHKVHTSRRCDIHIDHIIHSPRRCGIHIDHMIYPSRRCGIHIDHMIHSSRRRGIHIDHKVPRNIFPVHPYIPNHQFTHTYT